MHRCRTGGGARVGGEAPAAGSATLALVEWDYYASGDGNEVWGGLVQSCAEEVGVTVERQAVPRSDLITKVLLAAQQRQMPDVLMIDNPDLQEVAATGAGPPERVRRRPDRPV